MITTQIQQPEVGREYGIIGIPRHTDGPVVAIYRGQSNEKYVYTFSSDNGTMIVTTPAKSTEIEGNTVRVRRGSIFGVGVVSLNSIRGHPEAEGLLRVVGDAA